MTYEKYVDNITRKVFVEVLREGVRSGIFVKDSCKRTAMAKATTRTTF